MVYLSLILIWLNFLVSAYYETSSHKPAIFICLAFFDWAVCEVMMWL